MIEHKSIRDAKIEGYLTGLGWALAGSDPAEREETLASIREHLEEALPADASPEQVDQAIAALGPASAIANEATPVVLPTLVVVQPKETDWAAVMILVGGLLSAALFIFFPISLVIAVATIIAGIIKLRSREGNLALTKGGIAAASVGLVLSLFLVAVTVSGFGVFEEIGILDEEVIYQQDE